MRGWNPLLENLRAVWTWVIYVLPASVFPPIRKGTRRRPCQGLWTYRALRQFELSSSLPPPSSSSLRETSDNNNNSDDASCLLRARCWPTVYALSQWVLTAALPGIIIPFYSTGTQDSEALSNLSQGHTASEWQSKFWAQVSLMPETVTSWRQRWW